MSKILHSWQLSISLLLFPIDLLVTRLFADGLYSLVRFHYFCSVVLQHFELGAQLVAPAVFLRLSKNLNPVNVHVYFPFSSQGGCDFWTQEP